MFQKVNMCGQIGWQKKGWKKRRKMKRMREHLRNRDIRCWVDWVMCLGLQRYFLFVCLFVCFYISWNSNTLDAWYEELTHWKRPWCWERLKAGGEGTNVDEMVGWHHQLDGHAFEQAPGVGDRQGSLACCSPWGHKELDMTERPNWNERLFFTNLQSHLLLCWFNHIYAFLTELNCQPLHDSWFM